MEVPMSNSPSAVEEHIDSTMNKRLFMKERIAKYFTVHALRKKKKKFNRAVPSPKYHFSKSNIITPFHSVLFIPAAAPALTITLFPLILHAVSAMPCSPLTSVINLLWSIVMENKTKQVEFFEFLASHFKPNTYFLPTVESHNYIAASKESSTHSFIHCSDSRVHASWYLLKFFCF